MVKIVVLQTQIITTQKGPENVPRAFLLLLYLYKEKCDSPNRRYCLVTVSSRAVLDTSDQEPPDFL